jgi:DNA-binding response OmpR family regulator
MPFVRHRNGRNVDGVPVSMDRHGERTMGANGPCTLLLVEDESRLRNLVAQVLKCEGYGVVEAADGREGVDRFHDSGPFDLLLVDLNLPVFSGVEVCRQVRARDPDQRIMICSAAILADHERDLSLLGIGHFLTKPYRAEDLLAHIAYELAPEGRELATSPFKTRSL